MNGVQTGLKCKPNVKRCKRFVFAAHSPLLHPNTLTTKAISHFQADHILTRFVFPPLVGTLFNGILFSATGVILFVLCKVIFQPLFDLAYFPIMMRTIDAVAKIENRNDYAYILSHEFGLFLGRAFGLLLFIFLAYCVSQDFALKYALVIVAGLQLAAYPLAKNITNQTDTIEHENDK